MRSRLQRAVATDAGGSVFSPQPARAPIPCATVVGGRLAWHPRQANGRSQPNESRDGE